MSSTDEMEFPEGADTSLANNGGDDLDEAALEAMKARVAEMEAEAAKLREMQEQAGNGMGSGDVGGSQITTLTEEEKEEVDARSVYVGNVSKKWNVNRRRCSHTISFLNRSTMVQHLKKFSNTFNPAVLSIESRSCAKNSLVILKDMPMLNSLILH
jgi:hypothetical protein